MGMFRKIERPVALLLASLLLAQVTLFAADEPTVEVEFHPDTDSDADYPGYTGEHEAAIEGEVAETACAAGGASSCITIRLTPANNENSASTSCREDANGNLLTPTVDKAVINLSLPLLAEKYGDPGDDSWDDLFTDGDPPEFTPTGEAAVSAAIYHEFGHVCLQLGGGGFHAPRTSPIEYNCQEEAADNFARKKLCEEIDALCLELCKLIADADDPPEVIKNCDKCTEEGGEKCNCDEGGVPPQEPMNNELPLPGLFASTGGTLFTQNFQFRLISHSLLFENTGEIQTHFRELDPVSNEWILSTQRFSVGYKPILAAPRHSHDHYVLGFSDRSDTWILERIQVGRTVGSYGATRPLASTEIGEPYTTPDTEIEIFGGQGFVHPDNRNWRRAPREVLWSGSTTDLQAPKAWAIDPGGRFVVVYDHALNAIIRIAPNEANPYSVLYDSTEIQDLSALERMVIRDSSTYGRILSIFFGAGAAQDVLMLGDLQNDGDFETAIPLDAATYISPSVAGTIYRNFWRW